MKRKSKYFIPIVTLLLTLLFCNYALASDTETEDNNTAKGSITILLTDGDVGTSKANVVLEYKKVADVRDGKYYLVEDYGNLDLNTLKSSAELDEAARLINEKVKSGETIATDENGKAHISELEIGVYLLRVKDKARYENVSPVLVAIPTWNEAEGEMDYNITVIPKHTPNQPGEIITNTPDNTNNGTIMTGDMNHYMLYIALIIVSAVVLITYVSKKKRGGMCNEKEIP